MFFVNLGLNSSGRGMIYFLNETGLGIKLLGVNVEQSTF